MGEEREPESGKKREDGVGYGRPPVATRFGPGNRASVGHGRPPGSSIRGHLQALAGETQINGVKIPGGATVAKKVAEVIAREALKGHFRFCKEFVENVDGKVPDRIAGHDGGPLVIDNVFSQLSDDELADLENISARCTGGGSNGVPPQGPG
jgi:hypothetical protein